MDTHQHHRKRGEAHVSAPLRSFEHTVAQPMANDRDPYVQLETLCELSISLRELSFSTGKLPKGVEPFLEPIPPAVMEKWLALSKPWKGEKEDFSFANYEDEPWHESAQSEAWHFGNMINAYLTQTHELHAPCPIPHQTNWRQHPNNMKALNRLAKGQANWQVTILQSLSVGPDRKDPEDLSRPHITCFLTDDVPLREDALLTSEVATISHLAYKTAAHPLYKHSYVPVTVITACARHIRVVQGVLDVKKGRLELRKSRIVSFDKGIVANWQEFLTVLGWLAAKPVGRTV